MRAPTTITMSSSIAPGAQCVRLQLLGPAVGWDNRPLLSIAGIDSDHSAGANQIIKYALLGSEELSSREPTDAALEDTVLLLGKQPRLLNTVSPARLAAPWLRQTLLTATELQQSDSEASELFKILSFVDLLALTGAVGMPLNLPPGKSPASVIESWPLVQAFALQDMGPGGFFTQRTRVEDVSGVVASALAHVDAHTLNHLLGGTAGGAAGRLARQLETFQLTRNVGRRAATLTCEAAAEPIVSFAAFARLRSDANEGRRKEDSFLVRGARLLVGRFTADDATAPAAAFAASSGLTLGWCGGDKGAPPVHAIAETDDSSSGLRVARTLFLGRATSEGDASFSARATRLVASMTEAAVLMIWESLAPVASAVLYAGVNTDARTAEEAVRALILSSTRAINGLPSPTMLTCGVDVMTAEGESTAKCVAEVAAGESEAACAAACETLRSVQTERSSSASAAATVGGPSRRLLYIRVTLSGLAIDGRTLGSVAHGETIVVVPVAPANGSTVGTISAREVAVVPSGLSKAASVVPPSPRAFVRVLTAAIPATSLWAGAGDAGEGRALAQVAAAASEAFGAERERQRLDESAARQGRLLGATAADVGKSGRGVGAHVATASPLAATTMVSGADRAAGVDEATALIEGLGRPTSAAASSLGGGRGSSAASITLLTGGTLMGCATGTLQVFERGLVVHLPAEGALVVSAASMRSFHLVQGSEAMGAATGARLQVHSAAVMSPGDEGQRERAAGWVDATLEGVQATAQAASGGVAAARDVLIIHLKPSPGSHLASNLSPAASLWNGQMMGLLLPPEGSPVRSALLETLPAWRAAAADDTTAVLASSISGLPSDLCAGYLAASTASGPAAWLAAYEDAAVSEAALAYDAWTCRGRTADAPASLPAAGPSVAVTIITGAAGSGMAAVARGIVDSLGGRAPHSRGGAILPLLLADCSDVRPSDCSGEATTLRSVREALTAALSSVLAGAQSSMTVAHVLLVVPHATLPIVVAAVQSSALEAVLGDGVKVALSAVMSGCVSVLNSTQVHEDLRHARPLPGVHDAGLVGWIGSAVVLHPAYAGGGKDAGAETLIADLKAVNPGLCITRFPVATNAFLGHGAGLTVPHGIASAALTSAAEAWSHPRSASQRRLLSLSGEPPSRVLHVYAGQGEDEGWAGGATVEAAGGLLARRVVQWRQAAEASCAIISLPPTLDQHAAASTLSTLVALRADRPDLALLGASCPRVPGLPVHVTVPMSGGGEGRGTVYAAAWHATGVLRLVVDAPIDGAPHWRHVRVDASPHATRLVPVTDDSANNVLPFLSVSGVGFDHADVAAGVRAAFTACAPSRLAAAAMRGRNAAVSAAEALAIAKAPAAGGCMPLPPDTTYDGAGGWWDMAGGQLTGHPLLRFLLPRSLAVHDAAVGVYNGLMARVGAAADAEAATGRAEAALVTWPSGAEGGSAAAVHLPRVPLGVPWSELPSVGEAQSDAPLEELALELPASAVLPWWVQQKRAATWLARTLRDHGLAS
jgi:hypothetical protein